MSIQRNEEMQRKKDLEEAYQEILRLGIEIKSMQDSNEKQLAEWTIAYRNILTERDILRKELDEAIASLSKKHYSICSDDSCDFNCEGGHDFMVWLSRHDAEVAAKVWENVLDYTDGMKVSDICTIERQKIHAEIVRSLKDYIKSTIALLRKGQEKP